MKRGPAIHLFVILFFVAWIELIPSWAQNFPGSKAAENSFGAELQLHQLRSKIFGNERTIRVLLPPGYNEKRNRSRSYPVLYLNDGQNLFDKNTSVFNSMEWRVDETVTKLIKEKLIEPIIVVGIDNAGRSGRANEYLPFPDEFLTPPISNPQGEKYPEFLTKEVIPLVRSKYRISDKRDRTAIGGSSYGALISLYSFIKDHQIFGELLLESPSLYVSDAKILTLADSVSDLPKRVYLGVGTNEEGNKRCSAGDQTSEAVTDVKRLEKILLARGVHHSGIKVVVEDCAVHNEEAWARRLPAALIFLFPAS